MRKTKKTDLKTRKIIEDVAEKAASEAVHELESELLDDPFEGRPDLRDIFDADEALQAESPEDASAKDVFRDAWLKAQSRNDTPSFYIYKNGTWIANKPYPYSWERLQKEYGEGHYRIVAKSVLTGKNLVIQSQLVGNPHAENDEIEEKETVNRESEINPFGYLTMMNQFQERAESKSAQAASQTMAMFSTMMQTMVQTQSQAQQQFQMLLMEMQKQNQAMAQENTKILLTLATQKPSQAGENNLKMFEVMKLIQEERKSAKDEARSVYELVDKKAEALAEMRAEAMANGDEDESLGKTIAKGFFPVLSQILATQAGGIAPQGTLPQNTLPKMPQAPVAASPVINRPVPQAAKPQPVERVVKPVTPKPPQTEVREVKEVSPMTEKLNKEIFDRQVSIINLVGVDIVQALMDRVPAKNVTEGMLLKLEKSGTSRQTVLKLFTSSNDFISHARRLGVPEEADVWFREFYEEIKYLAEPKTSGIETKPEPGIKTQPSPNGDARKRGPTKLRENTTNL